MKGRTTCQAMSDVEWERNRSPYAGRIHGAGGTTCARSMSEPRLVIGGWVLRARMKTSEAEEACTEDPKQGSEQDLLGAKQGLYAV